MATFFNQASLSMGGAVTNSNITVGEISSGAAITKTAVTRGYSSGGSVVYAITLRAISALTNATLTDDLGAYIPQGGVNTVVPLDYVEGSLLYYVNGVEAQAPAVTQGPPLSFSGINLSAGDTATLIYETRVNGFAPLAFGECVTNTASVLGFEDTLTAEATVCPEERSSLTIAKALSPTEVTEGGTLTYTFIIQNSGNLAIAETDGLILSDTFNPILSNISVTLNGTELAEGQGYSYDSATGAFSTANGLLAVPAASYARDPVSGAVITTPGVTVLTVTGTV